MEMEMEMEMTTVMMGISPHKMIYQKILMALYQDHQVLYQGLLLGLLTILLLWKKPYGQLFPNFQCRLFAWKNAKTL